MGLFKLNIALILSFFALNSLQDNTLDSTQKPIHLVFIRHAEKKPNEPKNLSERGRLRAELIKRLFLNKINTHGCLAEFLNNNKIDGLYAHRPTQDKPTYRTLETILPLAYDLNKDVNIQWEKKDIVKQAESIISQPNNSGKTFLIASSHGKPLTALAKHLGLFDVVDKWDVSRFDMIWIVVIKNNKATLISLPQQLMPEDIPYFMVEKKEDLYLICPNYAANLN